MRSESPVNTPDYTARFPTYGAAWQALAGIEQRIIRLREMEPSPPILDALTDLMLARKAIEDGALFPSTAPDPIDEWKRERDMRAEALVGIEREQGYPR